jgi:hypothetical protein
VEKRKEEKNKKLAEEKWRNNDVDAGLALSLACFPANLCIATLAALSSAYPARPRHKRDGLAEPSHSTMNAKIISQRLYVGEGPSRDRI